MSVKPKYRHYNDIIVGDINDIIIWVKKYVEEHSSGGITTEYVRELGETPTFGVYQYIQVDGETQTTKQFDLRAVHQFVGSKDSNEIKSTYFTYFTNDGLFVKLNDVEQQVVLLSYLQANYPTISGVDSIIAIIQNQINGITINLNSCVNSIDLNPNNLGLLKINKVNGTENNINIAGNTRYRHFYTMKPTTNWNSPSISFFIDLTSSTPLSSDGLFNYLGLTPFWSTTTPAYGVYPVSGLTNVSSGVPTVAIGMFVYIEESGGIINKILRVLYNYNSTTSFDATTLTCVGVQDRFTGSWINISNNNRSNDNVYNTIPFGVNDFMIEQKITETNTLLNQLKADYKTAYDNSFKTTISDLEKEKAATKVKELQPIIESVNIGIRLLKSGNIPTNHINETLKKLLTPHNE